MEHKVISFDFDSVIDPLVEIQEVTFAGQNSERHWKLQIFGVDDGQ